jgi:salicylate hydroxylase
MIHAIDTPFKWALLGREPLANFSINRATLLGDAAHPTLPFLAQGANMALEDGIILARCLAAHADIPTALQAYEAARVERTAAIVRGSNDNARRFHNPALTQADTATAYIDREWTPEKVRDRYDWLYDYDALTVPI